MERMGSQNVTNFSEVRKKQIQRRILAFEPDAPEATSQARRAGVTALGGLAPSSSFIQALTSASVDTAAKLLGEFVSDIKAAKSAQKTDELLSKYGVSASERKPYAPVVAALRRHLEEKLSAVSTKTEAASSAADAIGATVLDVIRRSFPHKREPADVSPAELVQAVRKTPVDQFSRIFVENLISSLLRRTFDAAREPEISRRKIDALVDRIGSTLASELATELTRADANPARIRKMLSRIPER